VLGTGIDIGYPKENKKLDEKVLEPGAIISELPIGAHPAPENFPVRNRIIAGRPLGVVIVEGKQYSGSLITSGIWRRSLRRTRQRDRESELRAKPADQARHEVGDRRRRCHRRAAHSGPSGFSASGGVESQQRNLLAADGLNNTERKICGLLSAEEARHIDDLVETSGLNSSEVLATLFALEMKGIIRQLPGKQFCKGTVVRREVHLRR
jgi:DNA processing protein